MVGHRVLILQENPKERMEYTRIAESMGFHAEALPDGSKAVKSCLKVEPDMVIADMALPDFSPFEFLQSVKNESPSCEILFLSADPVVEDAVEVVRQGALDYLIKPVEKEQIELYLKKVVSKKKSLEPDQSRTEEKSRKVRIVTDDPEMHQLMKLASKVSDSSASVLIQGESGTGKELFAKYIHEQSNRSRMPFVAVNCAALPENLLESELFGHEKGAFTGAISRKAGKFELAHKGTLFLDEITEMQVHLQAKLLRVLQEKQIDRVGGSRPVDVDVRIIATTNREIRQAIESGDFREDLYYRLNTIPLVIPPLKQRVRDIEPLCSYFVKKYSKIDGRSVKRLTNEALSVLKAQEYPGNIRELENIIHRAVLLADGDAIKPRDLLMGDAGYVDTPPDVPEAHPEPASGNESGSLKEMEQKMIYHTLDKTEGNRTHAARILGISVRTLRNKLNEYRNSKE
ncbi:MAG: sigma-54 dependent transcriptional regulator [Desulfobacteraceae bacterium]